MAQWLVKEEPEHYSYDQLVKERKTVWAGVRNPLAQKHLRSIKKGDRIFYYHTGKEKAIVAIASAASDAYPDPDDATKKAFVVDVAPVKKLARAVTLAEIKADREDECRVRVRETLGTRNPAHGVVRGRARGGRRSVPAGAAA